MNFNQPINKNSPHFFIDVILLGHVSDFGHIFFFSSEHVNAALFSELRNALWIINIIDVNLAQIILQFFDGDVPKMLKCVSFILEVVLLEVNLRFKNILGFTAA